MKYVDDLTKVKPEEIQHIDFDIPVQAIVPAHKPRYKHMEVAIVFEDGRCLCFSKEGKTGPSGGHNFIFKSKEKLRLKPLHTVLAEQNMHWVEVHFASKSDCNNPVIVPAMFSYFGTIEVEKSRLAYDNLVQIGTFIYLKSWFEEVEE